MKKTDETIQDGQQPRCKENEDIDQALVQMELLYRSRCVVPQGGSNVTIREIEDEK